MAAVLPALRPRRVLDRQFRGLVTAMMLAGISFTIVYPDLLLSGPVDTTAVTSSPSDWTFKAEWLPLMALAAWVLAWRFRLLTAFMPTINRGMLAVFAWGLASTAWAPDPGYAFRQLVCIIGLSMIAAAFSAAAWYPGRFERLLRNLLLTVLVLSLLAVILLPSIGVHSEAAFELHGSWKGITYQKNGLGQASAIALILWVNAWAAGRTTGWRAVAVVGLGVLMLVKSRSSTSLMLATIAVGIELLLLRPPFRLGQARGPFTIAMLLLILVPALLYYALLGSAAGDGSFAGDFGAAFGKDATFSGRTYIWAELLRVIPDHLWFGLGFNSFWNKPPSEEAIARLGWPCPNGHNGYLDLLNELGIVGVVLFAAFIVLHARDIRRLARLAPTDAAVHWALLFYVLAANLTETGWFHPNQFTHLIAVFSSLTVSRRLFEARLQRAQPPEQPSPVPALAAVSGSPRHHASASSSWPP